MNARLRDRMREFRTEIRWTVVVVALAVLAVVALWPRQQPVGGTLPDSATPQQVAVQPVDSALRAAAGLPPCAAGPSPVPALAGASGTCLADGSPANVGAEVSGHATLINLWAAWCAPCRSELPALQAYSQQPGAVPVLTVQVQSDQTSGLELVRQLGVRLPAVWDGDNRIATALRAPNVLPVSFVVTPNGEVRRIDPPVVLTSAQDVRAVVQRTLGASGG